MNIPENAKKLAVILLGNFLYALAVAFFILPAGLITGGTTGIALFVQHQTGLPVSTFVSVFNVAMFVLGAAVLGRQFALTTLISTFVYPLFLRLAETAADWTGPLSRDPMLCTVFAGLLIGVGIALVIQQGASTGGMDIPPLVLKKFFRLPVSVTLWAFDFCILLAQMMYNDLEDLLYGIILILVISFALNKILLLGTSRTEMKIVSREASLIREAILSRVDRGVTILHGEGGYMRTPTEVILSVVSNHEMPRIQRLARDIDPDCFIIVSQVTEVWGRGFSHGKQYEKKQEP